ncbi:MAG: CdaR family protein, partial [Chloroflexota bacterium]|nr:CdaR family protein [Chloroflexota bacterium]
MRTVRKRWTWLFDHVGTLVLSIIMGLIVWLIAINQENPLVVREFPDRVALRVRGLTETLQPTQDLSTESVRLTLRAPQTAWDRLEASDLNAYVDLTNLGPGVHDVLVQVDVANRQVVVIEVQ